MPVDNLSDLIEKVTRQLQYFQSLGVEDLNIPRKRERPASVSQKGELLSQLQQEVSRCQKCPLYLSRKTTVFGEGDVNARLMFIGEAPGYWEDVQGRPFVGQAGKLLTDIIKAIGLSREEVYIGNIVKCRPPENRDPKPEEMESCQYYLHQQIAIIRPEIICALGTFSAQRLLNTKLPISKLRGKFWDYQEIKLMATFHPAFLLRSPYKKRDVWEDMKKIKAYLEEGSQL